MIAFCKTSMTNLLFVFLACLISFAPSSFAAQENTTDDQTQTDGDKKKIEKVMPEWPHAGILGSFDRASIQRGYQVYSQVCASCHSAKYLRFRNLEEIGFTKEQVKAIAASYQVQDGPDEAGDFYERKGRPYDPFPSPFQNDNAARASNGGALPPDLSLIVKARMGHEDYIYSLLTGYEKAPESVKVPDGMNYNVAYSGNMIAMAAPLQDGLVEFKDGSESTVEQMSYDVVNFLAWASEPYLEDRKRMGLKVIIYLLILGLVLYLIKRQVWSVLDKD